MNSNDIIRFIRDFRIVKKDDNTYINISHDREAVMKIKDVTGLTNLDALYITDKELANLFDNTIL